MDRFENLPNIKENLENKLKKKPVIKSEKEALSKIDSLDQCQETINKTIENITINNKHFDDTIKTKGDEISKNVENLLKKLEEDANEHIKIIESSNLTEEEKKDEYIKCLEELDKISLLNQALENCIEISQENFEKFLEKPFLLNRDTLIEFLLKEEDNLKKNNVYDELSNNTQYLEELYNSSNIPYLKNYISQSSLLNEKNTKLYKLVVDENTDIGNVKELLITINNKDEHIQDQIKKISLKNISKENIDFIFSKNMKLIKKKTLQNQTSKNVSKYTEKVDVRPHKNSDTFLEVQKEESDNYIDFEYEYPNITFKNCDCSEFSFHENFKKIQKLKLYSCQIPFLFNPLEDFKCFPNINELYLDNCDIIDENFKEIYFCFLNNEQLRQNLRVLSFKYNKLSVISVYKYIIHGDRKKLKFESLQFLDFSNNNINYFNFSLFDGLNKLRVIDFSNNNIQLASKVNELYDINKTRKKKLEEKIEEQKLLESKKTLDEAKLNNILVQNKGSFSQELTQGETPTPRYDDNSQIFCLFLVAGNMVLNRENVLEKYLKFLIETIPKIDYDFTSFNFSGMFYKKKFHKYLYEIDLLRFRNTLVEIDFSFCNLTDSEVSKFLTKEFLLKKLKKINLSSNKLTDNLFKLLIENNLHEIYENLKELNLSNNEICLNQVKEVKNFSKLFDCIKKLYIYDTPAEENINNYLKKKIIRFNEEQNNKTITTEFNNDEMIIKDLLENNGKNDDESFGNQSGLKLYLNNVIDYKFIDAAKKLYSELFNKIDIKNKYNYFN